MEVMTPDIQIFNQQVIEMKNINRLLKVALINSYPQGKIHFLDVDNNTIITGRNASGKTTLMGVIAPFFGVPLSSIATRYEKLARNFKSMLYLACSIIHAKLN